MTRKTKTIQLRVTDEDHADIKRSAKDLNLSVTDYLMRNEPDRIDLKAGAVNVARKRGLTDEMLAAGVRAMPDVVDPWHHDCRQPSVEELRAVYIAMRQVEASSHVQPKDVVLQAEDVPSRTENTNPYFEDGPSQ